MRDASDCDSPAPRPACVTHLQQFAFDADPDVSALVAAADRRVDEWGGSDLRGCRSTYTALSRGFVWKPAKRSQSIWQGLKTLMRSSGDSANSREASPVRR